MSALLRHFVRRRARQDLAALASERDELARQLAANRLALARWEDRGTPTYDSDYLTVWHKDESFRREPRFADSYLAGMRTGHKLGEAYGLGEDLGIEWRVHVCCWAASHAVRLEGDFVECGTNTGIFSVALCHYLDFNSTGKSFYLFDTFSGIPEEQMSPEEIGFGRQRENANLFENCYELAKRNFAPFPKARLVRGTIPESLATCAIERVCYLHIDLNIALPERAAIAHFWDRLVPGAPVILDDYGWLIHTPQKRAMDEFAQQQGVSILTLPTGQGMLLKP